MKIVCTVGLPTNIVDALQWGGRAIRIGDEHALFVMFYESWALEMNLEDYLDANCSQTIDNPNQLLIGMKLCYMGTQNFIFLSIQQNPVLITAGAVRIIGADYVKITDLACIL